MSRFDAAGFHLLAIPERFPGQHTGKFFEKIFTYQFTFLDSFRQGKYKYDSYLFMLNYSRGIVHGVQMEEASEVMEEAPKKLTVWQKFLNLFGLYREN